MWLKGRAGWEAQEAAVGRCFLEGAFPSLILYLHSAEQAQAAVAEVSPPADQPGFTDATSVMDFTASRGLPAAAAERAAHNKRQAAVFDDAAAYFASPEASPPEVEGSVGVIPRRASGATKEVEDKRVRPQGAPKHPV